MTFREQDIMADYFREQRNMVPRLEPWVVVGGGGKETCPFIFWEQANIANTLKEQEYKIHLGNREHGNFEGHF